MDVEASFKFLLKRQIFFCYPSVRRIAILATLLQITANAGFFYFQKFICEKAQLQNISEKITPLKLTKF
jgi:hypothetical protein